MLDLILGPHTHRDNPLSRIMCGPIAPPVTVCHTVKIGLLFYAGGKSLSDTSTCAGVKSTVIHTSVNIFETSKRDNPQYFVDKVKDKRRNKNNNLEFLIGWRGFPEPKNDTWESLGHLSG